MYEVLGRVGRVRVIRMGSKKRDNANEKQFTTCDFIEFMSAKKILEEELDFEIQTVKSRVGKSQFDLIWDWPYNFPADFDEYDVPAPHILAQSGPTQMGRDRISVPKKSYDL